MGILAFVSMIAGTARLGYRYVAGLLAVASCIVPCLAEAALSPSNVLVLYNADDSASRDIAEYYAQKRPGVRLLGLSGVTTAEEVTASYYLSNIRPQILPALDVSTDVIVTTKGLPLRIRVSQTSPGTYVDPYGVSRTITSGNWKRYSSLESELARIDTVSTWQQMGDQMTNFTPSPIRASNPYYWKTADFSNQQYGIRLTSRLDAFTVDDVKGMIDRAGNAYMSVGSANNPFHFVIDDDPNAPGSFADNMERLRDLVLQPRGMSYTYDAGNDFVKAPAVSNPDSAIVSGYVTHGVQGGAPLTYLSDPVNGIQFHLANGAVFASWESFNAQTFTAGVSHSQGLVAEWIARGGTAGIGHVAEPTATSTTVAREDALFDLLLGGKTWVEAAWGSTYQLSYVNTVIGDPLMRYKSWVPGDLTLDGVVDAADVVVLQNYWMQNGGFRTGDLTGDGFINVGDFQIVQQNWLMTETGSICPGNQPQLKLDSKTGRPVLYFVPEPGCWLLVLIGVANILLARRRS
jgi:uncharacterized protein (TIGR03790 family)